MHVNINIGEKYFFGKIATISLVKVACKRKLFLIELFLAKSVWDFFAKTRFSSVETIVSEIKDNKPVKTNISIFVFTSIISAFIPPFLLFKGCNQATHNIRNQGFFMTVSSCTQDKTNRHTNHESCFQEKSQCRIALIIVLI